MNKVYPIECSPLYRMRNRRMLARVLKLDEKYFKKNHTYKYDHFSGLKPNGAGTRNLTVPEETLKSIQKRICKLMSRIETPEWVISGKKNHSYISNARNHCRNNNVKTMDISQFYDSVKRKYVYDMFKEKFLMADDISWIMTDLVIHEGILPTGSPTSQLVVYWSYSDMFVSIYEIAQKYKSEFTLYVDDMTFSSNIGISKHLRKDVEEILNSYCLHARAKKDHYYQSNVFKKVTGVGIKKGKLFVPNQKRYEIIKMYKTCLKNKDIIEIEKLRGLLISARQIEPDIFPEIYRFVEKYKDDLKVLARNRHYCNIRKRKKLKSVKL